MKIGHAILITTGIAAAAIAIAYSKKPKRKTGRNIIVGDSHAVGISKLLTNVQKSDCAVGGWTVKSVTQCLSGKPVDNGVSRVFISIGTNGMYSASDKVEEMIDLIKQKFPEADLYAYGGSYGWSGSRPAAEIEQRRTAYYARFKKKGVNMLRSGLGYFSTDSGAHSINSPQAKAIANEINAIAQ